MGYKEFKENVEKLKQLDSKRSELQNKKDEIERIINGKSSNNDSIKRGITA
jgi:uncharacterized protein YdcH (DUF465 family)